MPNGGTLRVTAGGNLSNQRVAIRVLDTGDGIPADLLPRLFEPFATAKERGTGLGLAISRRILEEHSGTIEARPNFPRGTVFELTLPLIARSEPAMIAAM